jgi:hypothetical protein
MGSSQRPAIVSHVEAIPRTWRHSVRSMSANGDRGGISEEKWLAALADFPNSICQRWTFDQLQHQRPDAIRFFQTVDGPMCG